MWALHPLPSRSTFHFSLFTFHFPKGALFTIHFSLFTSHRDTFHFPQGPLFTIHSSLFTSRRDTFHFCHAVRCVGSRSVLHWLLQRAALGIAAHCVFRRSFVAVFRDSAVCTFLSLFMKRMGRLSKPLGAAVCKTHAVFWISVMIRKRNPPFYVQFSSLNIVSERFSAPLQYKTQYLPMTRFWKMNIRRQTYQMPETSSVKEI